MCHAEFIIVWYKFVVWRVIGKWSERRNKKQYNRRLNEEALGTFGIFLCVMSAHVLRAQESAPLKLVQKYTMPANIAGHFDHFAIDL
jgi:hypothetical protein